MGAAADLVVEHGGSAILSETPEIYGAEHLLIQRAVTPEVGNKLMDLIHWWENYVAIYQGSLNNNPSPGNKAGGSVQSWRNLWGPLQKVELRS